MSSARSCVSILNSLANVNTWKCEFVCEKSSNEAKTAPTFGGSVELSGDGIETPLFYKGTSSSISKVKEYVSRLLLEHLLCVLPKKYDGFILHRDFFYLEFLTHLNAVYIQYESLASVKHNSNETCSCKSHCRVKLKLYDQEFIGEGHNRWYARDNTAAQAISVFEQDMIFIQNASLVEHELVLDNYTCLMYEKAARLQLSVSVSYDYSSSNMDEQLTLEQVKCTINVDEYSTHGKGKTKQQAKSNAAESMLKLLPYEDKKTAERKIRKKNKKNYDRPVNEKLPSVTYLYQLLQKRGEEPPSFVDKGLIDASPKSGKLYECSVYLSHHNAVGLGKSKKEAKSNAAEALLQALSIRKSQSYPEGNCNREQHVYSM